MEDRQKVKNRFYPNKICKIETNKQTASHKVLPGATGSVINWFQPGAASRPCSGQQLRLAPAAFRVDSPSPGRIQRLLLAFFPAKYGCRVAKFNY